MLGLTECWEPQKFFIQDYTLVDICCSLYGTMEKLREPQHSKKFQDLAERNLPKYFMINENKKM